MFYLMPAPFVMPIPKIGNHPTSCPCGTCDNARKRLAKSPYVQLLQGQLLAAHKRLDELNACATPDLSLEHKILELTDQLTRSQDGERTLTNVLAESRKIGQERESQLTTVTGKLSACQQTLKSTEDSRNILQTQLRHVTEERDAVTADWDNLVERCNLYKGQAERTGEANTALQVELDALKAECDGYAADLKTITKEANAQRLAADGAKALVKRLEAENAALLTDNASLRAQITQPADHHEEGRGARLSVIGWLLLVGGVNFLLGRWTR